MNRHHVENQPRWTNRIVVRYRARPKLMRGRAITIDVTALVLAFTVMAVFGQQAPWWTWVAVVTVCLAGAQLAVWRWAVRPEPVERDEP